MRKRLPGPFAGQHVSQPARWPFGAIEVLGKFDTEALLRVEVRALTRWRTAYETSGIGLGARIDCSPSSDVRVTVIGTTAGSVRLLEPI